ncbi:MAG: type II secretion system F family protein [Peptococcia bacterium]
MSVLLWIPALLTGTLTLLCGLLIVPKPVKRQTAGRLDVSQLFGYEQIKKEAESAGWQLQQNEFLILVAVALGIGVFIAILIDNIFYIIGGVIAAFYLPRFVVMQLRRKKRYALFAELPDSLKYIVARLIDYGSIPKAVEASLADLSPQLREPFARFLNSVKLNLRVEQALQELAGEIKIRKFTDFTDTLLLAHTEGINQQSVATLETIIDTMVEDVRALKNLQLISQKDRRDLIAVIAVSWFIPVVLSFLNTNNLNLFLDTFLGQIIMFLYFLTTIFVIVKGDEYLSLNLQDL